VTSLEHHWQRFTVHYYRNVFSHEPNTKVKQVANMLKAIHAKESLHADEGKVRDGTFPCRYYTNRIWRIN
jgi:transposase-like protein